MPINECHKQVRAMAPHWETVEDFVDIVNVKPKGERYLPMLNWRRDAGKKYEAYKCRAQVLDLTRRTWQGLTGLVVRKPVVVKVPNMRMLEDVTLTGMTFEDHVRELLQRLLSPGRCGLYIDVGVPGTIERPPPYQRIIAARNLHNWWTRVNQGYVEPYRVVLREYEEVPKKDDEFGTECIEQYRELKLVEGEPPAPYTLSGEAVALGLRRYLVHQVYRQDKDGGWKPFGKPIIPHRVNETLWWIPVQPANALSLSWIVETPPLLGLATTNWQLYMNSADLENGRHWTGRPQPYAFGVRSKREIEYGSTSILTSPNEKAHAGFLEFTGQGLGSLENAIKEKRELAVEQGARLVEARPTKLTATEASIREAGSTSTLAVVVAHVERTAHIGTAWQVWWSTPGMSLEEAKKAVTVEVSRDVSAFVMDGQEAQAWSQVQQQGNMSRRELFDLLKQNDAIPPTKTWEEHQRELAADAEAAAAALPQLDTGGDVPPDLPDDYSFPEDA